MLHPSQSACCFVEEPRDARHQQDAQQDCQQGRSERRGEEVHTALRVGRSP